MAFESTFHPLIFLLSILSFWPDSYSFLLKFWWQLLSLSLTFSLSSYPRKYCVQIPWVNTWIHIKAYRVNLYNPFRISKYTKSIFISIQIRKEAKIQQKEMNRDGRPLQNRNSNIRKDGEWESNNNRIFKNQKIWKSFHRIFHFIPFLSSTILTFVLFPLKLHS